MPKIKKPVSITLNTLDIKNIHAKYNIPFLKSEDKEEGTKLIELSAKNGCTPTLPIPKGLEDKYTNYNINYSIPSLGSDGNTISYRTETRQKIECVHSMIDYDTQRPVQEMEYNCFWCRHPIGGFRIGCPLQYKPMQVIKVHQSKITKDTHIIQENSQESRIKEFLDCESTKEWNQGSYYESYGVFCSVHCCQAWINDSKYDIRWQTKLRDSTALLIDYYNSFVSKKNKITYIKPAPHWNSLKVYGGNLTISKFREDFINMEEIPRSITIPIPKFVPIIQIKEHRHLLAVST